MNKYVELGIEEDDGVSVPQENNTEEYGLIYSTYEEQETK